MFIVLKQLLECINILNYIYKQVFSFHFDVTFNSFRAELSLFTIYTLAQWLPKFSKAVQVDHLRKHSVHTKLPSKYFLFAVFHYYGLIAFISTPYSVLKLVTNYQIML